MVLTICIVEKWFGKSSYLVIGILYPQVALIIKYYLNLHVPISDLFATVNRYLWHRIECKLTNKSHKIRNYATRPQDNTPLVPNRALWTVFHTRFYAFKVTFVERCCVFVSLCFQAPKKSLWKVKFFQFQLLLV